MRTVTLTKLFNYFFHSTGWNVIKLHWKIKYVGFYDHTNILVGNDNHQ